MYIAIVVPRYGLDVLGGAEALARGFAEQGVRRGWTVEVWSTCARSHYTWSNVYPAGPGECNGVTVRRFPITQWNPDLRAQAEVRLACLGVAPLADQYTWLANAAHSAPLYVHVARYARKADVVLVIPYAAPLVHYAAWAASQRVVLWPCLHNEPHAYLSLVHLLLESVWGVMLNSPEEAALATGTLALRLRRHAVLGAGVVPDAFLDLPKPDARPYLLYMGRLEEGKNLALLYAFVKRHAEEGADIRLKVLGEGPFVPPSHPAFEYRGFVSEKEKGEVCAGALALCQPSLNESFSLTIMESWLAGRPVLVHQDCAVTVGHVRRGKGGLWFRTYAEFAGAVRWLQENASLADRMGSNGRAYVLRNYTWPSVLDRFERIVDEWRASEPCSERSAW